MGRVIEGVIAINGEAEEKLDEIKDCPEPCDDGTVEVVLSSGQKRKMRCPVIAPDCMYGEWMERGLDKYIAGVMPGIGVPVRHLENYQKLRQTEAAVEAGRWAARGFLVLFGDTGSGKSFGAALAVRKYLKDQVASVFDRRLWESAGRAGGSVAWLSAMDITEDRENAARAKRAFLTVIDDLGGEGDTAAGQAAILGTILKRYDMKLPTVITTSLTMLDIDVRYGRRIADRLTEDIGDGGRIIDCGSVSLRNPVAFSVAGVR
jgi:hypothetical protein